MTGFTADLFHRGSLWGLSGRDCAIRGAFSSAIHSALVLPFQCWWARGSEITDAHPTTWCSEPGDTTTPLPHGHCRTLQNLSKVEGDQEGGSRACFSCGWVLCRSSTNMARFSFAPVVMRKEQPRQTGLAALLILTFSSPKLHVPAWLCSGFSLPFVARLCTSEAVGCSGLPLAGGTVPFLSGYQSCFLCVELTDAYRQRGVWHPGDKNPFLCWPVPFCGTSLSPVWQWGGQGRPKYKPERLNSHWLLTNEISSQGELQ